MNYKTILIILVLGLSNTTNALFFGLFSSKPVPKPDVIASKSEGSQTDRIAYENYLRFAASSYPPYASTYYVPVYNLQNQYSTYSQPQYTEYVQPKIEYNFATTSDQNVQRYPSIIPYAQPLTPSGSKFQRPITVVPSTTYKQTLPNVSEVTKTLNKLIEAPAKEDGFKIKILEYEIPEPQMSTSLYELPIPGIAPNFRTGAYLTKPMNHIATSNEKHSGQSFNHAYNNGDGTKISEEGQVVRFENGDETVVKRGQYEYIDAKGKTVLVKWIADDDGFRLVN